MNNWSLLTLKLGGVFRISASCFSGIPNKGGSSSQGLAQKNIWTSEPLNLAREIKEFLVHPFFFILPYRFTIDGTAF